MATPTSQFLHAGLCIEIPSSTSSSEPSPGPRTSPASQASQSSYTGVSPPSPEVEKPLSVTKTNSDDDNHPKPRPRVPDSHISLRSTRGMQGLLLAESGGGLVELDPLGGGSGFKQGTLVMPGLVTPQGGASGVTSFSRLHRRDGQKESSATARGQRLTRQGTLLSQGATPARNAAELKSLLGNSRSKIKSGAKVLPPANVASPKKPTASDPTSIALEQGKSRARVEVDILLDSEVCVEGAYLMGKLHVKIRKQGVKEAYVLLGAGKMRVVGFEGIPNDDDRHTFYQHAAALSTVSASSHVLYASAPDEEGFSNAREGQHVVPFAMKLPVTDGTHVGAKGPFDNRSGVVVKYIVLASFKLKDSATSKRSIAHFYRSCELYPYLTPSDVLAPAPHPLLSTAARSLFLGGMGKLKLTASLHRSIWIAGQRCCVGIAVHNESKKSVKSLTLSLIRTTTIFRPHPHLDVPSFNSADPDACQTTTTHKLVAETMLEAGQRGLKGHVTAKGWWTGVDPGVQTNFTHFILLPPDALSIVRSRLLEVQYAIRVSLITGSLSSEVSVMLPLRIINHLSIDPPPKYPAPFDQPGIHVPVPPLPIPSGTNPPIPTPPAGPHYSSMRDLHDGARIGRKDRLASMFEDDPSARDLPRSSGAVTISVGVFGASSPPQMPIMPKLEKDRKLDARQTGICSRSGSDDLRSVFENGRDQVGNLEDNDEDSDDSWRNDSIEISPVGDCDNLFGHSYMPDSEDEVDFVVGSARLEEDLGPSVTRFTDLHARDEPVVLQESCQSISSSGSSYASVSANGHGGEDKVIPQHQAQRGEYTHPRAKSRCKTPDLAPRFRSTKSQANHSQLPLARTAGKYQEQPTLRVKPLESTRAGETPPPSQVSKATRGTPPRERSQFSERVERLVATRRAAQPSIARSMPQSDEDGAFDLLPQKIQLASAVSETSSCPSPTRPGAEITPQPLTLRGVANSQLSPSKVPKPIRPAIASSMSGSVRSRIAELEVRSKVMSRFD